MYPHMGQYETNKHLNDFYGNLNKAKFSELNAKRILTLKYISKDLNKYLNNDYDKLPRDCRYLKIMDKIKTNPKSFGIQNYAEKFILFMFSVDPDFEAAITYGECDKINDVKRLMKRKIGVFDINLIKLEHYYMKHFMSKLKKEEINNEINNRVFK